MKILYVDDNPDDQEVVERLLIDHSPTSPILLTAHDEDSCMQQLGDNPDVRCVLLDYSLPGRDGLGVLETIKAQSETLPVIVLTDMGDEQLAVQAMLAGAAYYLPKARLSRESLTMIIDRSISHADMIVALEESRDYKEKAQRLDAVGQLAAGIAHDFNNLLSATQYAVEALTQEDLTPAADASLDIIRQSIARGASLSSRLLAFSRQDDLIVRPRSVTEVLSDLAQAAQSDVSGALGLRFDNEAGAASVLCDQQQLDNSLLNLIENAAEAISTSGKGSQIRVSARAVDAPLASGNAQLEFCVEDDGPGMSAEDQRRSIDPFFTTRDRTAGRGLGLTMVQAFANNSDGSLVIDSTEGEGTRIRLRLPRAAAKEQHRTAAAAREPRALDAGKPQILLVEDEDIQRQILTQLLQKSGFDVVAAANPKDAMEQINLCVFDMLLTDIQMPGESGFRLAERVRGMFPAIPVLYMTAYADNPDYAAEQLLGPVLQKPVKLNNLIDHIQGALR